VYLVGFIIRVRGLCTVTGQPVRIRLCSQ